MSVDIDLKAKDQMSSVLDHVMQKLGIFNKQGLAMGLAFAGINIMMQGLQQGIGMATQAVDDSIASYRRYETEIAQINTLLSTTDKEILPSLTASLEGMSLSLGRSMNELTSGFVYITKKGFDASDSLTILRESSNLARVTFSSLSDAVQATSDVLSSYNLTANDSVYVSALLADMSAKMNVSLTEVSSIIERISPTTEKAGVGLGELAQAFTTLAERGIPARMAMSSYLGIIENLSNPTQKQIDLATAQGTAYDEFSVKAFGVVGAIRNITDVAGDNVGVMKELLGGTQEYNTALTLLNANAPTGVDALKVGFDEYRKKYDVANQTDEVRVAKMKAVADAQQRAAGAALDPLGKMWDSFWQDRRLEVEDFWNFMNAPHKFGESTVMPESTRDKMRLAGQAEQEQQILDQIRERAALEKQVSDYIRDQSQAIQDVTSAKELQSQSMGLMETQRQAFVDTHKYTEALRYIPMALQDASYSTKIFDVATQNLVNNIRAHTNAIKALQDQSDAYSISEQQNSLAIMKIQYGAMGSRHGLTRDEKQQIDELEKANYGLRISIAENTLATDKIKYESLNREQIQLDQIKMKYDEIIYTITNGYMNDLAALDLNLKEKRLLIQSYCDDVIKMYSNIGAAQGMTTTATGGTPATPLGYHGTIPFWKYDTGGFVQETGLALVHKGEYVIPRSGVHAGGGGSSQVSQNVSIVIHADLHKDVDVETWGRQLGAGLASGFLAGTSSSGTTTQTPRVGRAKNSDGTTSTSMVVQGATVANLRAGRQKDQVGVTTSLPVPQPIQARSRFRVG